MQVYLDRHSPEIWKELGKLSVLVKQNSRDHGLSDQEAELIKVRASQINNCAFCLDLHSRETRDSGLSQQKLDVLPAWRETTLFDEREAAVLAIAEAATVLPPTDDARADLAAARAVLGDDAFAAAEWVAATINLFNRVSILSEHPVRPRDNEGKLLR